MLAAVLFSSTDVNLRVTKWQRREAYIARVGSFFNQAFVLGKTRDSPTVVFAAKYPLPVVGERCFAVSDCGGRFDTKPPLSALVLWSKRSVADRLSLPTTRFFHIPFKYIFFLIAHCFARHGRVYLATDGAGTPFCARVVKSTGRRSNLDCLDRTTTTLMRQREFATH